MQYFFVFLITYFRHTKILLRFGSESDIDQSSGRWSVFFPKNIPDIYKRQFSLIEFSHLDKHNSSIEFTLVYPGIYTINYDNGKESDSMILKGNTQIQGIAILYFSSLDSRKKNDAILSSLFSSESQK